MITYDDDQKGKWQSVTAIYENKAAPGYEAEVYVCVYGATKEDARNNLLTEMVKLSESFAADVQKLKDDVTKEVEENEHAQQR